MKGKIGLLFGTVHEFDVFRSSKIFQVTKDIYFKCILKVLKTKCNDINNFF
jgi:hypothetical protein